LIEKLDKRIDKVHPGDEETHKLIKKISRTHKKLKARIKGLNKGYYNLKKHVTMYHNQKEIFLGRLKGLIDFDANLKFILSRHPYMVAQDTLGYVNEFPREMIKQMLSNIEYDKEKIIEQSKELKRLIKHKRYTYVLYESICVGDEIRLKLSNTLLSTMTKIKKITEDEDCEMLHFGNYTLSSVLYDMESTDIPRYILELSHDDNEDEKMSIDLQLFPIIKNSEYISIEKLVFGDTMLSYDGMDVMKKNGDVSWVFDLYDCIGDIWANNGRIFKRKKIMDITKDLNGGKTLERKNKVSRYLYLIRLYLRLVPLKLIDGININMSGLPKYHIEKKEMCTYSLTDPPYICLDFECGHPMSLQGLSGLLIEGGSEDSEAILCPICRESLKMKINNPEMSLEEIEDNPYNEDNFYTMDDLDTAVSIKADILKTDNVLSSSAKEYISNLIKSEKIKKEYALDSDADADIDSGAESDW
jgi:hypothetical protein